MYSIMFLGLWVHYTPECEVFPQSAQGPIALYHAIKIPFSYHTLINCTWNAVWGRCRLVCRLLVSATVGFLVSILCFSHMGGWAQEKSAWPCFTWRTSWFFKAVTPRIRLRFQVMRAFVPRKQSLRPPYLCTSVRSASHVKNWSGVCHTLHGCWV